MENLFLSAVVREINPLVTGRTCSRISLEGYDLFLDLRLPEEKLLKVSIDPASPCLYLSGNEETNTADIKSSSAFLSILRKHAAGSKLIDIRKEATDRRVQIDFEGFDPAGNLRRQALIISLTGRSSNVYLTNEAGRVEAIWLQRGNIEHGDEMRLDEAVFDPSAMVESVDNDLSREEIIEKYFKASPLFGPLSLREFLYRSSGLDPARAFKSLLEDLFFNDPIPLLYSRLPLNRIGRQPFRIKDDLVLSHFELSHAAGFESYRYRTLSEAAEAYYEHRSKALEFLKKHAAVEQCLKSEIKKRERLLKAIAEDRSRHENPEQLKRRGDLLMANAATAVITDGKARLVDYYDPDLPEIEVELDAGQSIQQTAARCFSAYQKARRALSAIEAREAEVRAALDPLLEMRTMLEAEPAIDIVEEIGSRLDRDYRKSRDAEKSQQSGTEKDGKSKRAGRWFLSTDGYEIVVGRNDRDNDHITFRLARPNDLWLHAADYPGSHVVIRNPKRSEVPYRTIMEAAELAAFHSSAKEQGKAAVHYTQKKFVTKPPRSKPGLVRLSSFKTVMVEPRSILERII